MEGKVILFDANSVKIGETFMRRARQLVHQQRAVWVDESQSGIKFIMDADERELNTALPGEKPVETKDDSWLYVLAERRLHDRKMFILHTICLVPGIIFLIALGEGGSSEIALILFGAWLMAYTMHAYSFAKTRIRCFHPARKEDRRARKLAMEVEKLRTRLIV